MKATKKAKLDKAKSPLQASTSKIIGASSETLVKAKRGFKRPSDELDWVIRLVNSLPPNPPKVTLITEQMDTLSPDLKAYLDSEWDEAMEENDGYRGKERVQSAYAMVLDMSNALRDLISEANMVWDEEAIYFHEPVDAGAYLLISNERTVKVQMSPFARAIEGAEIDYIRYCETCGKIFYAGRKNQPCCTPKCAKAQRQKRWRQRYKEGHYQS
jgi:hypothetical protein